MPPIACFRMSATDGIEAEGGRRTHPAVVALLCSPLEASLVEEEIASAVAAVDEDEGPACVSRDVSAPLLTCYMEQ